MQIKMEKEKETLINLANDMVKILQGDKWSLAIITIITKKKHYVTYYNIIVSLSFFN